MAHELYPPELQSVFQKLGLISNLDEFRRDLDGNLDENTLGFDDMEPVVKENLTTQLSACDDEFDLF